MLRLALLSLLVPNLSWGLTIYRVGGYELPQPELADNPDVEFVQLSWEDFAAGAEGVMVGLEVGNEGQLAPVFIPSDENMAVSSFARGGGPGSWKYNFLTKGEEIDLIADGDSTTFLDPAVLVARSESSLVYLDLGGRFLVNRVVVYPRPNYPDRLIEGYTLYSLPKGTIRPQGKNVIARGIDNRNPRLEINFVPRLLDQIQLNIHQKEGWEIAELEVYGEGYVSSALYASGAFDLGQPSSLGEIRWAGFQDTGAKLILRTRSGHTVDPNRYWRFTGRGEEKTFRNARGVPLTAADYNKLKGNKAEITTDLDNWSSWSGPYDWADSLGTPIISPGPRQFIQMQLDFAPSGLDGAAIDFIEFRVTQPPVAGRVLGEIWPIEVKPGEETAFVYAMRPDFVGGESGFDRLVLETAGQFTSVDSVRVNEELQDWRLAEPLADQRLVLEVARMDRSKTGRVVEIFFKGRVFRFGTVFAAQVFDSQRPLEVGQLVEDGDATFRLDSNQRSVGIELDREIVSELVLSSRVFTPNGDQVNDQVHIEYILLELAGTGAVEVGIFDLAGRRVRQLYRGADTSGQYARTWDGREDGGSVVAPGLYLYRVQVDTDEGQTERSGLVAVVY